MWLLSKASTQKLIKTVKAQPKKTARQMMNDCILSNLVSTDTTKHILHEYELKGCILTKKPALNKKYLKARLSWSMRYEVWDANA